MILVDTFILEEMEVLTEEKNGQTCKKLRGIFQRADEANNNKRVYSKALLEREVTKLTDALNERRLMGELDHPSHDSVKLSNVSHLITNLHVKGNDVIGECELLNTPAGKVAQALVEGGVKIGISSRGMGTLSEGDNGTKKVNEDFKLVTFDLVADPSTRGAFPTLAESTQSDLVENIVKDTLDKAAKEKVFTTILKQKITEKTAKKGGKKDPLHLFRGDAKFGHNNPNARKRKHRTYDNAETPTETVKVQEYTGGHGGNPHAGEPEHLKAARRGSEILSNIKSQKAVKPKAPAKKKSVFGKVSGAVKRLLPSSQNDSTNYTLLRSSLDQKLNESKKKDKKGLSDKDAKMLAHGGSIQRADKWAKQMRSGEGAKAPETGKIIQGLLKDLLKDKDNPAGTGAVPDSAWKRFKDRTGK